MADTTLLLPLLTLLPSAWAARHHGFWRRMPRPDRAFATATGVGRQVEETQEEEKESTGRWSNYCCCCSVQFLFVPAMHAVVESFAAVAGSITGPRRDSMGERPEG